ncbi:MAG TPA: mechanosensitive ion channel family protein [Candidatus Saccharimonadales bacterium]|nr:mechanosensitive ion channel family protein [Candidatus Saccharimonadales bacterium]
MDIDVLWANQAFRILFTVLCLLLIQSVSRHFLAQIVRRVVRSHKYATKREERQREDTLVTIFRTASAVVLWIVGIILVLTELHVRIAALLTSAGVVSVLVGFGAQNAIKDLLAGMFIIMENQFRVGDVITVSGAGGTVSGAVESVTIRITRLRDLDGALHIIRNGDISIATNLSFGFSNVDVDLRVGYDANIDKVTTIVNRVGDEMAAEPEWQERIIEPIQFLRVDSFGQSSVHIKALGKVRPGDQWDVAGEFRKRIISSFKTAGIEIPLPQRVIHKA